MTIDTHFVSMWKGEGFTHFRLVGGYAHLLKPFSCLKCGKQGYITKPTMFTAKECMEANFAEASDGKEILYGNVCRSCSGIK